MNGNRDDITTAIIGDVQSFLGHADLDTLKAYHYAFQGFTQLRDCAWVFGVSSGRPKRPHSPSEQQN